MFYLLKHLMLLILVIFKLKYNNLIYNEILVLYASYVCLLHSRFIENHLIWILEDGPIVFEVVLSQWTRLLQTKEEVEGHCLGGYGGLTRHPEYLKWYEVPITFNLNNHPDFIPKTGQYPLIVSPIVKYVKLNQVLVYGGSSLNIMFLKTFN
jgi:hypothetical protein